MAEPGNTTWLTYRQVTPRPTAEADDAPCRPDEATRLVQAADRGQTVMGMTGPDLARMYALALGTGFRASEMASLTPERFDLSGDPTTVIVPAAYTKNGREAVQLLPQVLADRLARWVAALPIGRLVFQLSDRSAVMIRMDLEAAGIPYETHHGVMDFHALRGSYTSNLVASRASVKTCQVLARRSTPSLTIGIYAKTSFHDISGAVAALPDPSLNTPTPEVVALAVAGTEGRTHQPTFAHPWPISGGRIGSGTVEHWRR